MRYGNIIKAMGWASVGQGVVQALGLLAGIFIVRFLDPSEYAIYTLATAMIAVMSTVSDGGLTSSTMALGGGVWTNPVELGKVMAASKAMRRKMALYTSLVCLPVLLYLLLKHGVNLAYALGGLAIIAAGFKFSVDFAIENVLLGLHQLVGAQQKIYIVQQLLRIAGLLIGVLLWPYAIVVFIITTITQYTAWRSVAGLVKSRGIIDETVTATSEIVISLRSKVGRLLPSVIFFAFSAQLFMWLLSFFGTTMAVAELGALNRISQVFTLVSGVIATVAVPRFARSDASPELLRRKYATVMLAACGVGAVIVGLVACFPAAPLWVLGSSYAHLQWEIKYNTLANAIYMLNVVSLAMCNSRAIILNPVANISIQVAGQILAICVFDVGSVSGVIKVNIFMQSLLLVVGAAYMFGKTRGAEKA